MQTLKKYLIDYWHTLTTREQQLLALGSLISGLFLSYLGFYQPLTAAINERAQQVKLAQQQLALLKTAKPFLQLPHQGQTVTRNNLLSVVNQSLESSAIADFVSELNQQDNQLILRFAAVGFDDFIAWLQQLTQQTNVAIQSYAIQATQQTGEVKVELILTAT